LPPETIDGNSVAAYEIDYDIADGFAVAPTPQFYGGEAGQNDITIRISGVDPNDLQIQRVGFPSGFYSADGARNPEILISAAGSTSGGLLIGSGNSTDLAFDQIEFDDGTIWTRRQVEQLLINQETSNPNINEVFGFTDVTTIEIGPGDKVITQPSVDEAGQTQTFIYRSGDGFDVIKNLQSAGGGILDFADIDSTQVTLERNPSNSLNDLKNLVIDVDGVNGAPEGQVTLVGQFDDSAFNYLTGVGVDEITFADGVVWTQADIEAKLLAQQEAAAQSGANITIYGFDGTDTLTAGTGNDVLVGTGGGLFGEGSDTYVWTLGDGVTTIEAQHNSEFEANQTLRLEGVDPADVSVFRDPTPGSNDLILRVAGQKPIILQGQTALA
jgi:hypothetical protein